MDLAIRELERKREIEDLKIKAAMLDLSEVVDIFNDLQTLKKRSNMHDMIYSYLRVVVTEDGSTSTPVRVVDGSTIPDDAKELPYGEEIRLPVGVFALYHHPDCRYFAKQLA